MVRVSVRGSQIRRTDSFRPVAPRMPKRNITYWRATVENFRALVQELTGDWTVSVPRRQPMPESLTDIAEKLQRQSTLDRVTNPHQEVHGGRAFAVKELEFAETQLRSFGLMQNLSPSDTKSSVSSLNTLDMHSEPSSDGDHNTSATCSLDLFPNTPDPTSEFSRSESITDTEFCDGNERVEPKLLELFPLHSSETDHMPPRDVPELLQLFPLHSSVRDH